MNNVKDKILLIAEIKKELLSMLKMVKNLDGDGLMVATQIDITANKILKKVRMNNGSNN